MEEGLTRLVFKAKWIIFLMLHVVKVMCVFTKVFPSADVWDNLEMFASLHYNNFGIIHYMKKSFLNTTHIALVYCLFGMFIYHMLVNFTPKLIT